MLEDVGECHRGYFIASVVFSLTIIVVWSAVLFAQVLQAHRIPVQTTQLRRLNRFPKTAVLVVSKSCSHGPPFHMTPEPPHPPVFDFVSVVSLSLNRRHDQASVYLKRPAPESVLWREQRYTHNQYGRSGNFTCAFTAAGFVHTENTQCLKRTFKDERWHSKEGWYDCEVEPPFDPLVGLSVGNWSTEPEATSRAARHVQRLPSWPSESFFLVPTAAAALPALLNHVDAVLRDTVGGVHDYSMSLVVQQALSTNFPSGVWLFQAQNKDPFANIGPLMVTFHATRCEGSCAAGSEEQQLSATAVATAPQWRQPLCDPDVIQVSTHQGCVPIVFVADMSEAVVVSIVAFRWPNLFAQWLSPLAVFALLFPALVLAPYCRWAGGERGSHSEVRDLVNAHTMGRTPQLDDDV